MALTDEELDGNEVDVVVAVLVSLALKELFTVADELLVGVADPVPVGVE